ncbi:MAG TPA: tRNA dihydrouridine synthase DusB, partial [Bacteroidales bacterium]|nr:tRNA dihydrouridine synthase DusB [Bacteroidales bacterium]
MTVFKDLLPPFPLILSPMEAITNKPFRRICKRYGADILITEFISSDALLREVEQSVVKMSFDEEERPLGIQIFGNNEESLT